MSNVTARYGIILKWDPRERSEIRKFNALLWEKLQIEHGILRNSDRSVSSIPGFISAVHWMISMGESDTDIGTTFGVSYQRVGQWRDKFGLMNNEIRGTLPRIWSNEESCFIPIETEDLEQILRDMEEKKRKDELRKHKKEARRKQVQVLQELAKKLERAPFLAELCRELNLHIPDITRHWGYRRDNSVSYVQAIARLYRAAGFPERPRKVSGGKGLGRLKPKALSGRKLDTLGYRLTKKRLKAGLTQAQVGAGVGVSASRIGVYENGKVIPPDRTLKNLAKLLGATVNWLQTGKK